MNRQWLPFQSADYSRRYLETEYKRAGIPEARNLSYKNSQALTYYLTHGSDYFGLAKTAPVSLQPVLLFYGLVQLLKGCILTIDPHYPGQTILLAHGVSTRKRKKPHFAFATDSVLIQKRGFFTHAARHMFHIEHLEGTKIDMESLMAMVPEFSQIFKSLTGRPTFYPLKEIGEDYRMTSMILDDTQVTADHFFRLHKEEVSRGREEKGELFFSFRQMPDMHGASPFRQDINGGWWAYARRSNHPLLPELLVLYLLLYNLGMIARYETEWWRALLAEQSADDLPFILTILETAPEKIFMLLEDFLLLSD